MAGFTILDLPTEILQLIVQYLDSLSLLRLKITCRDFHAITPPLSVAQMLQVEKSAFGRQKGLYTCGDCMRLRPKKAFADAMIKKKARWSRYAGKRFCVDCGTNPRPGFTRYSRGSHIVIEGQQHVVCFLCGAFREAAVEGGRNMSQCQLCYSSPVAIEQRAEEQRAQRKIRRAGNNGVRVAEDNVDLIPRPGLSQIR